MKEERPMLHTDAVVEVKGLQMRYGDSVVLDEVDFTICRGEVLVLLGPNGAGKTTTIEILEGFRGRSGGSVSILGADPAFGDEAWRAKVGIVLQSWRDHSGWQVRELLHHLGGYFAPYSTDERKRPYDTDALLELVGLTVQARVADWMSPSGLLVIPNCSFWTSRPRGLTHRRDASFMT